ncbi:DUF6263 family protein [Zeaxanthinibacter sp. PT1]|uniref:DUF6263 family protein n=1 Tax=Zeaxanthinibacter TaxID=561554 RepID=UPI00234BD5D8|nr:DUF6263 family protein [Zeaxanthinibacter sp. PT1]MDC6352301.1 DUF6263 family protein [Zeaxanthinibacter sp. PT1]
MIRSISICFLFCLTSLGFGQTTLQYSLEKGEQFTIRQEAQQQIIQDMPQGPHQVTNTLQSIMKFEVTGLQQDNYYITVTFKELNISLSSNLQGTLLEVNAGNPGEGDQDSNVFHSLLESPIEIVMSRTGNVLDVKGGDIMIDKMVDASGLEDEYSRMLMQASLERDFGSKALSNSFKQLTYFYPDRAVEVGDQWSNQYQGKISARNDWTLEELLPTKATILGKSRIKIKIDQPEQPIELEGLQHTRLVTLRESGFVRSMKVESNSKGYSSPMALGEVAVPTRIKSTITYILIQD